MRSVVEIVPNFAPERKFRELDNEDYFKWMGKLYMKIFPSKVIMSACGVTFNSISLQNGEMNTIDDECMVQWVNVKIEYTLR